MSLSVTPSGVPPWLLLTWLLPGSKLDLAFERGLGRPGHPHRRAVAVPLDREPAAARRDVDGRREDAEADADDHRGARAGAARKRLAGAAFPDAQARRVAPDDLHEAGVDAAR